MQTNKFTVGLIVRTLKGMGPDYGRIVEVCEDLILVDWVEAGKLWSSVDDVRLDTRYHPGY